MNLSEPILAELQHEATTTKRMLERVPQGALTWQPHEKSMSLGRLAAHIAEIPGWLGAILTQDELDFSKGDYKPPVATSVTELLEMFDKNISSATHLLKEQSNERLLASWRLRNGEHIMFELPRLAVIRSMVLNHIVHHRGQLSVYLRLQNVPLPSVYGPTADEPVI